MIKIKSKKGAVLLMISAASFLLTVFLLANYQLKADFLGQKQVEILDIAAKGENALLYIDQIAKLATAETWGSEYGRENPYIFSERFKTVTDFNAGKQEFEEIFESNFKKHLGTFNKIYEQDLEYENFEISIKPVRAPKDKLGSIDILGKSNKKIMLQTLEGKKYIKYSVKPNFHITSTAEELNLLK